MRYSSHKLKNVLGMAAIGTMIFVVGYSRDTWRKVPAIESSPAVFTYTFNTDETLDESDSPEHSRSPYWWVDSGGKLIIKDDTGQTIQGHLFALDKWRLQYALANPTDTDHGFHPQNIFRLVSKNYWRNVRVQFSFKITGDHFSESPARNASNGVLLMSRYLDGDTLYYAGLRVDGTAVIKKKYKGTYYTMAQKQVSSATYSPESDETSNLLPHDAWLQMRSDTWTDEAGSVHITLSGTDASGQWREILSAVDDGKMFDRTPPIDGDYRIGIRTDFMDVQFKTFQAARI